MPTLRQLTIRLAAVKPGLQSYLLPLLRTADEGEEEESKGKGKMPSGKFLEFLEDWKQKVRNPDTGNMVSVKSLKGPAGKKLQQQMFKRWLLLQEGKEKGKDKGKGKGKGKKEEKGKGKEKVKEKVKGKGEVDSNLRKLVKEHGYEKARKLLGLPGKTEPKKKDERTRQEKEIDSKIKKLIKEHGPEKARSMLQLA